MKTSFLALIAAAFSLLVAPLPAQLPALVDAGVSVATTSERSTLDRRTRRISSTLEATLRNTGTRRLEPPLHVALEFTPAPGSNLAGLTVPGALGGIGQPPYQTFYLDLSSRAPAGLDPGASLTFSFSFERPSTSSLTFAFKVHAFRNRDPIIVLGGPYSGQQGAPVAFDASATTDPDGDTLTFEWDFGDGTSVTGPTPQHTYIAPGFYTVVLSVGDSRGGISTRETTVPILPEGDFALARTRTLDGAGHPLGAVRIIQSGPDGEQTLSSETLAGFASLGGTPGPHAWRFEREGHLTVHRSGSLGAGQVRLVPFPWLMALNPQRTALSVLNPTLVQSPQRRVMAHIPAEAFAQAGSAAITELHGQALPAPLPFGWSPLAAFHIDLPSTAEAPIQATLALPAVYLPSQTLVFARFHPETIQWRAAIVQPGSSTDSFSTALHEPGSYAVVIADAPQLVAEVGQPLPPGDAPSLAPAVSAIGEANPAQTIASRDPEKVTTTATVRFSNAGQPLASGAWFVAEVEETYDLLDGRALKAPDYDATFYAYRHPGTLPADAATAQFPMRPRILFGPDELIEANLRVNILPVNQAGGGVVNENGGILALDGLQIDIPPQALTKASAASLRTLALSGISRLLGGLNPIRAFALDLPSPAPGSSLQVTIRQKLIPNAHFVLARLVQTGPETGLQPILRLRSDSAGSVASHEPADGARLPGITGAGQFVLLQIADAQGLITGVVRGASSAPVGGALVRVPHEPWLSITDGGGAFATLAPPGSHLVSASNPATDDSGDASALLADAAAHAVVAIQLAPLGPKIVSTTPADGAQKVNASTPISIRFSKALDPASLGADSISVLNPLGVEVVGSLSLSKAGTEASFLPANPLEHAATYTVTLASDITDRRGRTIEGSRSFSFSVLPFFQRPAGAQLVIYEPGAENVPAAVVSQIPGYQAGEGSSHVIAHGSPGTADPEVPVILVNQNTGATATVLSKPDGSFANFIAAAEEDFIEAVFVNRNGTRVTVPATRQLFDNGRIGLYKYGGILEAESDGGPVQVLIEPEAIAERTVFAIKGVTVAELQALVAETPPEAGGILGGIEVTATGSELTQPMDVSFPVEPSALGLPEGMAPEDAQYVVAAVKEEDGVRFYEVLDDARYSDGKVTTNSPPYPGFSLDPFAQLYTLHILQNGVTVTGRVVSVADAAANLVNTESIDLFRGVPGALVSSGRSNSRPGIQPGTFVGRANSAGFYALKVPVVATETSLALKADSLFFPGQVALKVARDPGVPFQPWIGHLAFTHPGAADGPPDTTPPLARLTTPPGALPVGSAVDVKVVATDGTPSPQVTDFRWIPPGDEGGTVALNAGESVQAGDVEIVAGAVAQEVHTTRASYRVTVAKPALVGFSFTVVDAQGNRATYKSKVLFSALPPEPNPFDLVLASDPGDRTPPSVVDVDPSPGQRIAGTRPIRIVFSEAMSTDVLSASSVTLEANGVAVPFRREQSADRLTLTLYPAALPPNATLTLSVSGGVTDLSGNLAVPFSTTFSTMVIETDPLDDSGSIVQSVAQGGTLFSIDRDEPRLLVHTPGISPTDVGALVGQAPLPAHPRALALHPRFSFKRTLSGPIEHRTLVVVAGGLVGEGNLGQWFRIFDVENPANPVPLAGAFLTNDFSAAVTTLKVVPGNVLVSLQTAEGAFVFNVNLQAFILGANASEADFDQMAARGESPGVDLDQNGDFVGAGEKLPSVLRNVVWGLRAEAFEAGRTINDVAASVGGMLAIALPSQTVEGEARRSALKVLRFGGVPVAGITATAGVVEFPPGDDARRIAWVPGLHLYTAAGETIVPMALAVGFADRFDLYDVSSNPENPVLIQRIHVPGLGSVRSMGIVGNDRFGVVGQNAQVLFDLREIGRVLDASGGGWSVGETFLAGPHPSALLTVGAGVPGRSFGITEGWIIAHGVGGLAIHWLPPVTTLVRRAGAVLNPDDIVAGASLPDEGELAELVGTLSESPLVIPAQLTSFGPDSPSATSDPPLPAAHQYLLIQTSGAMGDSLDLVIEALGPGARRLPARGPGMAPVVLTSTPGIYGVGGSSQPAVAAHKAYRLTSDPLSPYFNLYLSSPLLAVREAYGTAVHQDVRAFPGRQALQIGEALRVSFEAVAGHAPVGLLNTVGSDPPSGPSFLIPSFCADYVGSANPRLGQSAPVVDGVNLQSGEYTHTSTDSTRPGRGMPLVFTRTYNSQSHSAGMFGRNWVTNFDVHICEIPTLGVPESFRLPLVYFGEDAIDQLARPGDAILREAAGELKWFRRISAANGNLDQRPLYANDPMLAELGLGSKVLAYFESPPGVYEVLYRLTDSSYLVVDPGGSRRHFDARGRIRRAVSPYAASEIRMDYRADGRLATVTGDTGESLAFGYYLGSAELGYDSTLDRVPEVAASRGAVARVQTPDGTLEYRYDANGLLERFSGPGGTIVYGYTAEPRFQLSSIGRADGSRAPAHRVQYDEQGLVTETDTNGVKRFFSGAQATAAGRKAAGNASVRVGLAGTTGSLRVDDRGRVQGTIFGDYSHTPGGEVGSISPKGEAATTITYDENNPVHRFRGAIRSVKKGSSEVAYTYDSTAWNRRVMETSPGGVIQQWSYEDMPTGVGPGRKAILTVGPVVQTTEFNDHGMVTRQVSSEGGVSFERTTLFDADGRVVGHRSGNQPAITGSYQGDSLGSLNSGSDSIATLGYDGTGRATGVATALAGLPEIGFRIDDQTGRPRAVTVGSGESRLEESFTFDPDHPDLVKTLTRRDPGVPDQLITYQYDSSGRLESYVHEGKTTRLAYYGAELIGQTGPGFRLMTALDLNGVPTGYEENGVTTSYLGFEAGAQLKGWESAGARYENSFDARGRLTGRKITDLGNAGTLLDQTLTHDAANRIGSLACGSSTWRFTYFPDGAVRATTLNGTELQEITRDGAGLVTSEEWFDGLIRLSYSSFHPISGMPSQETIQLPGRSRLHSFDLDDLGRVTSETVAGAVTTYSYDGFGNLHSVTDPDGVRQQWRHSPGGVPLGRTFGDGTSINYVYNTSLLLETEGDITRRYDDDNLPSSVTNADGTVTTFGVYDSFFRATAVSDHGFATERSYEHARLTSIRSTTDHIRYRYDGLGRMTRAERGGWEVLFGHDPCFGRDREASPLGEWRAVHLPDGGVARETYPSGETLSYTLNSMRLPTSVGGKVASVEWADVGLLEKVAYPGGLELVWTFDGQIRAKRVVLRKDGALIDGRDYELSPGGRVLRVQNLSTGRFDVVERNAAAEGMRVTGVSWSADAANGQGGVERISGIGFTGTNREIDFSAAVSVGATRSIAPAPGDTIGRDQHARAVTAPVWLPGSVGPVRVMARFEYDMNYRLHKVERLGPGGAPEVTIIYRRDGLDRIIEKTVSGPPSLCTPGTWRYAWRDNTLLEEYQVVGGNNELLRRYVYAGDELVLVEAATVAGAALDPFVPLIALNGSVEGYFDLAGNRVTQIDYSTCGLPSIGGTVPGVPFGAVSPTLLFHGAFFDHETGLYDMGGRTLHPVFGSFLQMEPAMYEENRALYLAFNGDPFSNIDPSGMKSDSAAESKKAGVWARASNILLKGGLKTNPIRFHWTPKGSEFYVNKNSKGFDFAAKAMKLASGFLPEEVAGYVETAAKVSTAAKYVLELPENLYERGGKADAWRLAQGKLLTAEKALKDLKASRAPTKSFAELSERVQSGGKTWAGYFKARSEARGSYYDFARNRIGPYKTVLGGSNFVLNKLLKFQKSDNDVALGVGLGVELGSAITEFADLSLRGATGMAKGQAEISIAGGYLKGAAAGRLVRGASAWQAYDIGFLGGKAGFALALYAVDPGASRLYLQDVATFEKNGGIGAHLLGGMIDAASENFTTAGGFGVGGLSSYLGRKITVGGDGKGYPTLTDALRTFGDWHPVDDFWDELLGSQTTPPAQVLINGLSQP
jgi:RHS repeat-associated protein